MSPDSLASPASPKPSPPPWGLFGSIAWCAAGIAIWMLAQLLVVSGYAAWLEATAPGTLDFKTLATDGFLLALATVVAGPFWIGVAALAARRRGWTVRDYLALIPPKRSEILFGIACLAPLLIGFDLLALAFGRETVPAFMRDSYISAQAAGALGLFFVAVVIVGPVAEEVAFRGFLFRGLSATRLGVAGTLVVTSAIWAVMHIQYDFILTGEIFLIGLVLGWLRWASGSTLLTIILHIMTNFVATVQAAIKVEWMS
jgi:membrane protease YdiL (CAAX protease family)